MSRRRRPEKREILPDPQYGDIVLSKFMNNLMLDGKKAVAEKIVYGAMETVESRSKTNPIEVFHSALENIKPQVEVRSRRVGGANFQIPQPVREGRKLSLAMKWLIGYSRSRNERSMAQKLANEIMAAAKEEGAAFKKKEDTHKMAEANKAFAHYRW